MSSRILQLVVGTTISLSNVAHNLDHSFFQDRLEMIIFFHPGFSLGFLKLKRFLLHDLILFQDLSIFKLSLIILRFLRHWVGPIFFTSLLNLWNLK